MIYEKQIDWSIFVDGFALPIQVQSYFQEHPLLSTTPGQKKAISLLLDGKCYPVELKNLPIVSDKRAINTPRIQIRYRRADEIASKFREIFNDIYLDMSEAKNSAVPKTHVKSKHAASIYLYTTEDPLVFRIEY